jgi:serine/threonine protein kinase
LIKQLLQNNPEMKGMIKKTRSTGVYLGSGSYGEVAEVVSPQGTVYAAKKFWMSQRQEQFLKMFVKEVKLLSRLNHPNIVKYHGISIEARTDALLLLMERLQTNLSVYLLSDSPPDYPRKLSILKDVATGLTYLHGQDPTIIHRDLTAKNVLLDSRVRAKIADFGNARIAEIDSGECKTMSGIPGTQPYMPPEACSTNARYNKKIDIFSFGHLALFTMIQESPDDLLPSIRYEQDGSVVALTELQRREKYIHKLFQQLDESHPLVTVIKICLNGRPTMRPSAYTLVSKLEDI